MKNHSIPDRLDGEPDYSLPGFGKVVLFLLQMGIFLIFFFPVALIFGLLYFCLRIFFARPPIVPNPNAVRYYLSKTLTEPEILTSMRLRILLNISLFCSLSMVFGVAWFIDEIFFSKYKKTLIVQPLFHISAARSGSTQFAHYLEENPQVVTPKLLQQIFPFLWLWKIVPVTIGRFVRTEKLLQNMEAAIRPAFLERHEVHPFKSGTFEVLFSGMQLVNLSLVLGPKVFAEGMGWAQATPETSHFWEGDLIVMMEKLGKKLLYHAGPKENGKPRTLLIKGHFLASADVLENRFPDAHFVTMLRDPLPRFRSLINFFRSVPEVNLNGALPWSWILHFIHEVEIQYCLREKEWYQSRSDNVTVLRFRDYVNNLGGTMEYVYQRCLINVDPKDYIPKEHAPRNRKDYSINRTLEQLGVDENALKEVLYEYIQWCHEASCYDSLININPK